LALTRQNKATVLTFVSTVAFSNLAVASELAGVTVPETVELGNQTLILNGMGLKEIFFIDIYVTSLYLPNRTSTASDAIQPDVPKRLVLSFIRGRISRERIIAAFRQWLEANPAGAVIEERLETFFDTFEPCRGGDTVVLDYVPDVGVQLFKNGRHLNTIPGADFMRAIWDMFLGENTVSEELRDGMLGL